MPSTDPRQPDDAPDEALAAPDGTDEVATVTTPAAGTTATSTQIPADDDVEGPLPVASPRTQGRVLSVDDDDDDLDEDEDEEDDEDEDEEDDLDDDEAFLGRLDDDERGGAGLAARLGVEALGTFVLVLVVVGVALYGTIAQLGPLGAPLAGGLALVGITAAFGHLSGGHFNPAVTFGTALAGLTRWVDVPLYWLAQLVGGLLATSTLFLTIPTALPEALQLPDVPSFFASTANSWGESSPLWEASGGLVAFDQRAAFVFELVAAAILTAVVLGTARRRWSFAPAPAAVGLTYAALLLLTSPVTGGAVNPVRATAAAVLSGPEALGQLWLFWVAPLLGAALAGLAYYGFGRGGSPKAGELVDDVVSRGL